MNPEPRENDYSEYVRGYHDRITYHDMSKVNVEDEKEFFINLSDVCNVFLRWAVQQSPYEWPDNLQTAFFKLKAYLSNHFMCKFGDLVCDWFVQRELDELLQTAFCAIPEIYAWNSPKAGGNPSFVAHSRYWKVDPDYDIVDLGALAGNITCTVLNESDNEDFARVRQCH